MGFALSFAVDTFVKVVKLGVAKVLEKEIKIWKEYHFFFLIWKVPLFDKVK